MKVLQKTWIRIRTRQTLNPDLDSVNADPKKMAKLWRIWSLAWEGAVIMPLQSKVLFKTVTV
jgi:hypothetical protein